jgi:hypothetical protein
MPASCGEIARSVQALLDKRRQAEAAAPRIKKKPEDKALHTSTSTVTGSKRKTADA